MVYLDKGSIAPQFVLPNQDGLSIRLADYKGKNILLWKQNLPHRLATCSGNFYAVPQKHFYAVPQKHL